MLICYLPTEKNSFCRLIMTPIRVSAKTQTAIDNVISNFPNIAVSVVNPAISDHYKASRLRGVNFINNLPNWIKNAVALNEQNNLHDGTFKAFVLEKFLATQTFSNVTDCLTFAWRSPNQEIDFGSECGNWLRIPVDPSEIYKQLFQRWVLLAVQEETGHNPFARCCLRVAAATVAATASLIDSSD
ncbi:hypothetical protein J6590_092402 [Homalodisca vitripennis]|nr:hypothetical protein J6590_092402 [Homalodisca vitripennis]